MSNGIGILRHSFLRQLADIDPGAARGVGRQLIRSEGDGAVGAAAGRIHHVKAAQRFIEVHVAVLVHREGAHAAHRVTDALLGLFGGKHTGLASELGLELRIHNTSISRAHHKRHPVAHGKRQRLGNARRFAAHGLGRQFHGRAGCGEFHNVPFAPEFRKVCLHLVDRHLTDRLSPPSSTLWNNSTTHISGKP